NVDVINMVGASVGVRTSGAVTNDGDFDITTEGAGAEVQAGNFNNGGELDIAKIDGLTLVSQKASTGSGSVVNFLEIQNGGTLTVFSGGSLTVDGQATLAKSNKALSNDIGVNVNTGGTLIAQDSSTVNVINMIGTSTGVLSNGSIQDAGDFNITTENIGLQVQSNSVDVTGSLDITVVEGPAKSIKSKGAISVVNFLEIQNGGTLEIFSGGQVIVDGGAVVAKNKALNNDIGVTVQSGGLVNTHVEANLQVRNIVGVGTGISNDGTVNNDGTINIINAGNNGLHNNEQFDNNDCAVFTVDSKIVNTTDGNVRNTGLLSTTYGANGGQHENNGSIINEGVIEDPNNAFVNVIGNPIIESGDGGTTNYTLFTPLSTCYGENIDNATNKPFDTNSTFNINVWYTDLSLTQVAGLFVYAPEFGINRFTPNFNVLGPGVHTLYVSVESENFSDCGAQNVVLVELTIYELPQITPIDQEICIGDLTTIPLGIEDAGGTYTWYNQETDGTILTTGTSYTPGILPNVTTTYWVEASDGQGCESDGRTAVTLTVHDLPIPEMMTSNNNFEFCGYEDVLLGAGNYPNNYSYYWSTTATTQSITTNVAGVYTVTVSNENGCTTTASAELIDTSPIVEIADDMGICFGGSSTLSVGTYSFNDTYLWSNNSTTQTIAVGEGIYNVTVSDADGCTGTASIAVSLQSCCIAEAGILSVTSTDLCSGDDITVTTNGTEQTAIDYELYYLLVNESTGIIEVVNTTGIFSNVFPNDYEVYSYVQLSTMPPIPSPIGSSNLLLSAIGTSYMGCYELSDPQEVTMPDVPSQSISFSTIEGPTGLINIAAITIVGGTPPYSVDFTTSSSSLSFLSTLGVGVYSVSHWGNATWTLSITDDNGCENDDWIISSTDNPNINITNTTITKETCAGEENGAIDISVEGGTACIPAPTYTYTWSGPNSFTASTEDITDLAMGNYYVTISDCGGNSISSDFLVLRQPLVRGRGRGSAPCAATGNKTDLSNLGDSFLKIRPNPFSYYTTIEFGIAETALTNINIYTLDGRKVQEIYHTLADKESLHQIHFEAKDLYPGMYLLQLTTENGEMMMEKLIVR
ncbi:MAG: T9SS type A sorting domain-containing protein, partial [Chitinophagales bacterium]